MLTYFLLPVVDPSPGTVGAAINDGFGSVSNLILTVIVPAFFGIVLIVIGVRAGVKWLRRGANS